MRKDDDLNSRLQSDKQEKPISQTVKDALLLYYSTNTNQTKPPLHSTQAKPKGSPAYTSKRQRRAAIKAILNQLKMIKAAEERSLGNVPENLRSSPAFEAAEESISALDDALDILANAYY